MYPFRTGDGSEGQRPHTSGRPNVNVVGRNDVRSGDPVGSPMTMAPQRPEKPTASARVRLDHVQRSESEFADTANAITTYPEIIGSAEKGSG